MVKHIFLLLMMIAPLGLLAQSPVTGTVFDYDNNTFPLQNVTVRNLGTNQSAKTKASGQFVIPAKVGDLLEFSFTGYHTDTLFLVDLAPKTIYLPVASKDLKEVKIVGAKINPSILAANPNARVSKRFNADGLEGKGNNDRAGGMRLNLGFGKFQKDREKIAFLEERDRYETEIRENFNEETIKKLVKLDGQELKDFMVLYRPGVALIKSERPFNYTYYIVKCYHNFMRLPASERKPPSIPAFKSN